MKAKRLNNYTEEEKAFVRELFNNKATDAEDVALFNKRFPYRNITKAAYCSLRKRLGVNKHFANTHFTEEEDAFIKDNLQEYQTVIELTDAFNSMFPHHSTTHKNIQKRMAILGIRKGTHNVRKGVMPSKNPIETVIIGRGKSGERHGARVKTENGYVSANAYFRKKYFGESAKGVIVNLNGNKADFSKENVMLVSKSVYHSLCWRSWFFCDAELTRTAILTAELLLFFPDLTHNENQYYRLRRE